MTLIARPFRSSETFESVTQVTNRNYSSSLEPVMIRDLYTLAVSSRGWNVIDFHLKKKRGELLPYTPYRYFEGKYSNSFGNISYNLGTDGSAETRTNFVPGFGPPYVDGYYYNIGPNQMLRYYSTYDTRTMVQAAAAKVYAQGYDALTALAELRQTIRLFTGLRKRLIALIKRGLSLDSGADIWLELRYGWRTLFYDMVSLSEAFADIESDRKRFTERVGFSESYTDEQIYACGFGDLTYDVIVTTNVSTSLRGSVTADIEPPKFQFNPITTAWEIVTLSFVIDWFLKVGTWLQSLSFLYYSTAYTAAGGVEIHASRNIRVDNVEAITGYYSNLSITGSQSGNAVMRGRTPMSISTIPRISVNLDVPKLVDLLAILRGGNVRR